MCQEIKKGRNIIDNLPVNEMGMPQWYMKDWHSAANPAKFPNLILFLKLKLIQ